MIPTLLMTILLLPLALVAARVGRRRWIRRCGVARVRAELALFHHGLGDVPTGRHRLTRF
ncbi:hypothetical protein [Umezawaea sp. Da 62-37]|uniref:hypothetical protein n=1 Tax=Umezawaea sp. Da 62-37 TaxID=3075927 RepID=UPI0028F73F89|nr:hypothetical protein [Umezawaea sp. Da 62-37]WNV91745.1 hypothetical protein RM788_26895 [Umezawaea sp. Da 62-37]